ncbi:DUF6049 family protein [Nocardioides montaniterrae]
MSRAAAGLLGCAVLSSVTLPAAHATHPRRAPDPDAPLQIVISDLTPGVLPRSGPIVVSGTVTNTDSVPWTDVKLYPYVDKDSCVAASTCSPEMRSATELAEGASADPTSPVGERITDANVQQTLSTIAPGQTLSFQLTVPQKVLRDNIASPQPGVYWFGVQAIGASSTTERDLIADGRARTYLPYIPAGYAVNGHRAVLPTAIVVPLRAQIRHYRDGRVAEPQTWLAALGPDGTLSKTLSIGQAAGGLPMTWLVDPAVLDVVHQLGEGNPTRLVAAPGQQPSASASASATPADDDTTDDPVAAAANTWLDDAHRTLSDGRLMTLPYGDPQILASDDTAPLYRAARAQSGLLDEWKLPSRRAIAGPDGYVDPAGLATIKDRSVALLADDELPRATKPGTVGTHPLVPTSSGAAAGGPEPGDRFSSIAVRQRILSEAAIRLVSGDTTPLVVQLPAQMGAGGADQFWSGLSQTWLRLTDLGSVIDSAGPAVDAGRLKARHASVADQYAALAQTEASQLIDTGDLLQSVVTAPHSAAANAHVRTDVVREALAGTSYSLRTDPSAAARLTRSRAWILDTLGSITLSAPPGVTLSSAEGSFSVTVTNDLDVPVTVHIAAEADGARVEKVDPVALAAHSRASVRLDVHTSRAGVRNVRLELTDGSGRPIGSVVTVPIRTGSVGIVIWAILGTGAGILFAAIVIRLRRRLGKRSAGGAA